MAKTNFTKVEEALAEGLRKITVSKLLDEADQAKGITKEEPTQISEDQKHLVFSLEKDCKELSKHDQEVYKKIGVEKKNLKKYVKHPEVLTPQEWEKLKQIKLKVDQFKQELEKILPKVTDDSLVEQERHKHLTKRFNIREKWIPLK